MTEENRDCSICKHEDTDACDDCTTMTDDGTGCSCHFNPPCGYCEGNNFEEKE
jgi:hypothetical protein